MKQTSLTLILFILLSAKSFNINAQELSDYANLTPSDYINIDLPPISLLFENAKQGATFESSLINEQIQKSLLKKEKKSWLNFLSIRGSYQYGMYGYETSYTDVYTPVFLNYTTSAQNSYSIGAGLSIPLDALFDLNGRIKRQKLNVRYAELEKEIKFEETKKEIIELYVTALAQLNSLKQRAEYVTLANAQYEIVEKDFTNGVVDSGVLSVEKERQSKAIESYENNRSELNKSLMILELITHTSIIK
ncbi:MAG: TolC family protein [Acetoanaerobium sp.]|uniref:TolC family protein n=1 Tax=Macellibacteroides fermentans TaxID=879969 RepID=UPI001B74FE4E|nr:TolC family protein [Acetoanaerobium sp.]